MKKIMIAGVILGSVFICLSAFAWLTTDQILNNATENETNPIWSSSKRVMRVSAMDGVSADTYHIGTGSKVALTAFGSRPILKNFIITCENSADSASVQMTEGPSETVKFKVWVKGGETLLIPQKITFSGTVTITADSAIRVRIEKD